MKRGENSEFTVIANQLNNPDEEDSLKDSILNSYEIVKYKELAQSQNVVLNNNGEPIFNVVVDEPIFNVFANPVECAVAAILRFP